MLRVESFFLLRNVQIGFVVHPTSTSIGTGALFRQYSDQDSKLTIYLHLMARVRMCGTPLALLQTLSSSGIYSPIDLPQAPRLMVVSKTARETSQYFPQMTFKQNFERPLILLIFAISYLVPSIVINTILIV
jgi:hypothetical protein